MAVSEISTVSEVFTTIEPVPGRPNRRKRRTIITVIVTIIFAVVIGAVLLFGPLRNRSSAEESGEAWDTEPTEDTAELGAFSGDTTALNISTEASTPAPTYDETRLSEPKATVRIAEPKLKTGSTETEATSSNAAVATTADHTPEAVLKGAEAYCNKTLTGNHGVFTSLNFSVGYPHKTNQTWCIEVPPNCKVHLKLLVLHVPYAKGCKYDFLAMYDGITPGSPRLGRYCRLLRKMGSAELTASSNRMFVWLRTGAGGNLSKGVKAKYSAVNCPNRKLSQKLLEGKIDIRSLATSTSSIGDSTHEPRISKAKLSEGSSVHGSTADSSSTNATTATHSKSEAKTTSHHHSLTSST